MRRSVHAALFAALGWLALCAAHQPAKQPNGGSSAHKTTPSPEASVTPAPPPSGEPSSQFTPYPGYNPDPCYRAKDKDAADLCAQWRAAIAAEKAVGEAERANIFAIIAALLSFLTVIGLIFTLLQGRGIIKEARRANRVTMLTEKRARREARSAARDQARILRAAEHGAKASVKQARIFQRDSEHTRRARIEDRRPWVAIKIEPDMPFWFDGADARTTIQLQMTNLGGTIARDVIAWADMYVGGDIKQRNASLQRVKDWVSGKAQNAQFHRRIILPGQTTYFEPGVGCPWVEADLYRIIAYVEYVFDGSQRRHFTWEMFEVSRNREKRLLIKHAEGTVFKEQISIFPTGIGDAT